jgi:hypothetical protein
VWRALKFDDVDCAEFVGQKVDALAKCRALRGIHPQVGMLLLRKCCVQALNFFSQVFPPSRTAQHLARFDPELAAFVLDLLTLPGRPHGLACVEERLSVFRQRLRLPTRFNGAGLLGVDGVGPAFVGSVIACREVDTVLANNIAGLERFAALAVRLPWPRSATNASTRPCTCRSRSPWTSFPLPATWSKTRKPTELPRYSRGGGRRFTRPRRVASGRWRPRSATATS